MIKHVGNEQYVLTSGRNGNNLQCQPNGNVQFANRNEQLWEMWGIEYQGDAVFFVSKHTNKVLQCAPNGAVRCENTNRLEWEKFRVLEQDGSVVLPCFVMEQQISKAEKNATTRENVARFQALKLEVTEIRDWSECGVQFSCLKFYANGEPLSMHGATAYNPKGRSPGNEGPENALSDNLSTKFLDFEIKSGRRLSTFVVVFPAPMAIEAYELHTANDCPGRDPVSWTLSGCTVATADIVQLVANSTVWKLLDRQTSFPAPRDRYCSYPLLGVIGATLAQGLVFSNSSFFL